MCALTLVTLMVAVSIHWIQKCDIRNNILDFVASWEEETGKVDTCKMTVQQLTPDYMSTTSAVSRIVAKPAVC